MYYIVWIIIAVVIFVFYNKLRSSHAVLERKVTLLQNELSNAQQAIAKLQALYLSKLDNLPDTHSLPEHTITEASIFHDPIEQEASDSRITQPVPSEPQVLADLDSSDTTLSSPRQGTLESPTLEDWQPKIIDPLAADTQQPTLNQPNEPSKLASGQNSSLESDLDIESSDLESDLNLESSDYLSQNSIERPDESNLNISANKNADTKTANLDRKPLHASSTADSINDTANVKHPKPSNSLTKSAPTSSIAEPDEHSLPIVTSLFNSLKNWFMGGNLVVRVGVIVLLMGVVLLLRLVSDYIEIPIEIKLIVIGVIGLALAALGLKLVRKRYTYGITLQGAGLAIAYLSTFFGYRVYHVIASLPSFITLGLLAAVTVGLAVRQNAFPLALLAFSGAFLAPILTSSDTGSLTSLFGYYLLLNVAIAIIAHYRAWKVLNLLGASVTFGLAYYWGFTDAWFNDFATFKSERWSLVVITSLHWLLYLFIAIRFAQQILIYNAGLAKHTQADDAADDNFNDSFNLDANFDNNNRKLLFPIDTGLMFATPLLAFGLLASLLHDMEHALSVVSLLMAMVYLSVGWALIQRSRRYALLTEGMLALGFGFLALIVPLELDGEWVAFGWSVQGLAMVWFGRRSLRAWLVIFGVLLQALAILSLSFDLNNYHLPVSNLALAVSALSWMVSFFVLRQNNSPYADEEEEEVNDSVESETLRASTSPSDTGVSDDTNNYDNTDDSNNTGYETEDIYDDEQLLAGIDASSPVFRLVWDSPALIYTATFIGMLWTLFVSTYIFNDWFLPYITLISIFALTTLVNLALYWAVDRYRTWSEASFFVHGLATLFYGLLISQLPIKYEGLVPWQTLDWGVFAVLLFVGLLVTQLWIKRWYVKDAPDNERDKFINEDHNKVHNEAQNKVQDKQQGLSLSIFDHTSWLATVILMLAISTHYWIADADDIITMMVVSISLIMLIRFTDTVLKRILPWFNWRVALKGCSVIFTPILLFWFVIINTYHDGRVWKFPYIPVLNLLDIALLLVFGYMLHIYYFKYSSDRTAHKAGLPPRHRGGIFPNLLLAMTIWMLSSMLVRTLSALAKTPLWLDGALLNEDVQVSLAIFWTIIALLIRYKLSDMLPKIDWRKALLNSSYFFIPVMLFWVVVTNSYYSGEVWGLFYIPVLNLYDIALLLILFYTLCIQLLGNAQASLSSDAHASYYPPAPLFTSNILLKAVGIIGFWVLSSMLVRTLHTYAGTPLWTDGAWDSDKVQTSLTILWTSTALFATFISSRNNRRFWWFMGISLLGIVVLKLVLVDLSQTSAIWRVISFIGAGSLILLIGYLAPLPPEETDS